MYVFKLYTTFTFVTEALCVLYEFRTKCVCIFIYKHTHIWLYTYIYIQILPNTVIFTDGCRHCSWSTHRHAPSFARGPFPSCLRALPWSAPRPFPALFTGSFPSLSAHPPSWSLSSVDFTRICKWGSTPRLSDWLSLVKWLWPGPVFKGLEFSLAVLRVENVWSLNLILCEPCLVLQYICNPTR